MRRMITQKQIEKLDGINYVEGFEGDNGKHLVSLADNLEIVNASDYEAPGIIGNGALNLYSGQPGGNYEDYDTMLSLTPDGTIVEGPFDVQDVGDSYLKVDSLGHVIMEQLPIADPHVNGALWVDKANGNILKVSLGN